MQQAAIASVCTVRSVSSAAKDTRALLRAGNLKIFIACGRKAGRKAASGISIIIRVLLTKRGFKLLGQVGQRSVRTSVYEISLVNDVGSGNCCVENIMLILVGKAPNFDSILVAAVNLRFYWSLSSFVSVYRWGSETATSKENRGNHPNDVHFAEECWFWK